MIDVVDRRLIGFTCIILISATIGAIVIFGHEEEGVVKILASRTPSDIPGSRPGSPSYSFEIMATRDLPDLIVSTYFLVRTWPMVSEPWTEIEGRETSELIKNVQRLAIILHNLEKLEEVFDLERLYTIYTLDAAGDTELHIFDFTEAVGSIAGQERIDDLYTIYAIMVHGNDKFEVYAGSRDFFFRRKTVITEIDYEAPGISKCYRSTRAIGGVGTCENIEDAPMGIIHLSELRTNDRLRVDVDLDTSGMFGHSGLLQLVTIRTGYGDGPTIINLVGVKSGG